MWSFVPRPFCFQYVTVKVKNNNNNNNNKVTEIFNDILGMKLDDLSN